MNNYFQMKKILLSTVACFILNFSMGQNKDSLKKISILDQRKMLTLLNIDSLRKGVSSDPKAQNAANYNEALANPYPILPDALLLKNGSKVTNQKVWWNKRRREIITDFDNEVYGITPTNLPKVQWEIVSSKEEKLGMVEVTTQKIIGHVDNASYPAVVVDIDLTLTIPNQKMGKIPVVIELAFVTAPGSNTLPINEKSWQQQVVEKGWAAAVIIPISIQPDNGAGLKKGIIGMMNKGKDRQPQDWGTIKAWAWGTGIVIDYLEENKRIDIKRIALQGHSRFGKTAAVTMAYDSRIAIGYISSSGQGGLKLNRRNMGELVENNAGVSLYHWMAGNFLKYAGPLQWNDLPVDAHELIALCAPRPLFIGAGNIGDEWCDPKGMFMAAVAAEPVYTLLNKKGIGTNQFPPIGTGVMNGQIAFRQHLEGHTPQPNWAYFLDYASRYFKK